METKKTKRSEIPEELQLKAGMLAKSLMKLPPMSQKEMEEEWRRREDKD